MSGEEGAQLLWVISHAAARFPPAEAEDLSKQLLKAVLSFGMAPAAVAAHLAAIHRLADTAKDAGGGSSATSAAAVSDKHWCSQLLSAAQDVLSALTERKRDISGNEASVLKAGVAVFTVGEIALTRQVKVPSKLVVLVQALTGPKLLTTATAFATASQQPGASQLAPVEGLTVPTALQAHAWAALGKLCVVDELLAKKCVPLFVQELGR